MATTADELRERYAIEREKRLRPDGNDQYLEVTDVFEHYVDDPYVSAEPREALAQDVTFVMIGGGFSGLVTGARLKQAGVDDVRIIEKGGDFGGTWYWNRYPGAQCDTTSFIYMPLLEETGHMPTEKYAHAPEIFEHCQRIGRRFGLYDDALFSTEVTGVGWDDDTERWIVTTNRGDRLSARYVAIGAGPLHRPKLPGIEGVGTFAGHSFHTSRWDYDYTGGDPAGAPMERLADQRVGIIGTGATSVQCVPYLARDAGELYVFQRTPSSIDVRNNAPTDPDWYEELPNGWQRDWLLNFATIQTGGLVEQDYVMDGWTDISHRIFERLLADGNTDFSPAAIRRAYEAADDSKMNEIRARVDTVVADERAAEALKPWYRQLCKRPCFHDEYLQAFNRPNCHLVDTDGRGVERIDETGVVVGDEHYDLDCIIYASGFEVGTPYAQRTGFDPIGRDGTTLSSHWSNGMRSLHGLQMHGFPNLFIVGFAQAGGLISNVPHNLVEAADTIAPIVAHAESVGATVVEPEAAAEQEWVDLMLTSELGLLGDDQCTPGYYNNEGQTIDAAQRLNSARYPSGAVAYFDYIEQWRTNGEFAGLSFR